MATIMNFFLKFYIVFFLFASSAHAADYKKLFSFPSINVEKSPYINLIFLDGSPEGYLNLPPNVYHRYKKIDPFSDEKEYKNTHVHCEIKVLFSNISGEKIGIKDALYGAIDLKLILNNGFIMVVLLQINYIQPCYPVQECTCRHLFFIHVRYQVSGIRTHYMVLVTAL